MAPERAGVPIIQIGDWPAEPLLESGADVESRPVRMYEVRGSLRAQNSRSARRTGSVEPDHDHVGQLKPCRLDGYSKTVGDLLQADLRTFLRARWVFAKLL